MALVIILVQQIQEIKNNLSYLDYQSRDKHIGLTIHILLRELELNPVQIENNFYIKFYLFYSNINSIPVCNLILFDSKQK